MLQTRSASTRMLLKSIKCVQQNYCKILVREHTWLHSAQSMCYSFMSLLYSGNQNGTQCSRCGLSRAVQIGTGPLLDLLETLLLLQTRTPFSFFYLVSTGTPRSLSAKLFSSWLALSIYLHMHIQQIAFKFIHFFVHFQTPRSHRLLKCYRATRCSFSVHQLSFSETKPVCGSWDCLLQRLHQLETWDKNAPQWCSIPPGFSVLSYYPPPSALMVFLSSCKTDPQLHAVEAPL